MRHGKKFNHLSRTSEHRKALLKNLSIALIEHKRIVTTVAKAKALRRYIEPLITKAKTNSTHNRRVVFSYLQNKEAVKELFGPVAAEVGNRPGGYVRVIRTSFRKGDGAEMALIELVDFNKDYSGKASDTEGRGKKRRRRRRGKGGAAAATAAVAATTAVVEDTVEETTGATTDEAVEMATETATASAEEATQTAEQTAEAVAEQTENIIDETTTTAEETVEETTGVSEEEE